MKSFGQTVGEKIVLYIADWRLKEKKYIFDVS